MFSEVPHALAFSGILLAKHLLISLAWLQVSPAHWFYSPYLDVVTFDVTFTGQST